MRCKICNKKFEIKKNFSNLLKVERYYICDTCYKKYPISLDMFTMPLSKGRILYVYTLFSEDKRIDTTAFIKEISMIYKFCLNKYRGDIIILEESFKIDESGMYNFNVISKLLDKNIVVITDFISLSYV